VPTILTVVLGVTLYSTDEGVTLVTVGTGAATVNPAGKLPTCPPAAVGLVTVTVYAAGVSDVFGHQNRSCPLLRCTYGTLALAEVPLTVAPCNTVVVAALLIRIVAPSTKLAPAIVIWLLGVTPKVTDAGVTLETVGVGATTMNPAARASLPPPAAAGLVTLTSYAPGANDVFGHQNRSCPLLRCTYGTLALAEVPLTVAPCNTVVVAALLIWIVAPTAKLAPAIVIWVLGVTPKVTDGGVTLETVGVGATTMNPAARASLPPPAAAGLVTLTSYAPGANDVFGHQNRSCPLLRCTYGTLALAVLPGTVSPDNTVVVAALLIWIVAPTAKLAPAIVIWVLGVTP
jgi:hypothetical protein